MFFFCTFGFIDPASLFLETGFSWQYSVEVSFHFQDCSWSPFPALPISVLQEKAEMLVSLGFPFLTLFSSFSSPVSLEHLFKNIDLLKNYLNRLCFDSSLLSSRSILLYTSPGISGPKLNKSKTEVPKFLCQISLALDIRRKHLVFHP